MVPSNADAVDKTPATPPSVLSTTVDLHALKDRETPPQSEGNGTSISTDQNPPVEESSSSVLSEAKSQTPLVNNGSCTTPADGVQEKTGGLTDVTNGPVQNGVHAVDQKSVKGSPERKTKRPEGPQLDRGYGSGNGHKQRKTNDISDQHMNESLHSHQQVEEEDDMDATLQHSEAKYKRLKRKLKEVLEVVCLYYQLNSYHARSPDVLYPNAWSCTF